MTAMHRAVWRSLRLAIGATSTEKNAQMPTALDVQLRPDASAVLASMLARRVMHKAVMR